MLKVTLDTNILVSSTISEGNEYELLKLAKLGKIRIVLSLDILKEFKDVISRSKFGFSEKQIADVTKHIISLSEIVIPKKKLDVIKEDPADNRILECAFAGKVKYIVSGDGHLLDLKKYKRIPIVKTSEFLKII